MSRFHNEPMIAGGWYGVDIDNLDVDLDIEAPATIDVRFVAHGTRGGQPVFIFADLDGRQSWRNPSAVCWPIMHGGDHVIGNDAYLERQADRAAWVFTMTDVAVSRHNFM